MKPTRYGRAWLVETDLGRDAAVVVERGTGRRPWWWVLCPATATLHLPAHAAGSLQTVEDCSDPECQYGELHRRAAKFIRQRNSQAAKARGGQATS